MVWGCFARNGQGHLVRVEITLNAEKYINLCRQHLKPSFRLIFKGQAIRTLFFQQDGAPCHTARLSLKGFLQQNITLLKWPAQSPDLNPIEHLWDEMERQYRSGLLAKNPSELWEKLQKIWESLDQTILSELVDSMPLRIQAVIDAKGGHTKY
eukprot:GCRY01008355.1.p1 GENE.GCRY01008355.1~~GCRY01008355.1.p1  ORF type:complete len:153 (+),score=16.86 GCRY01008355.1:538-996(+)